MDSIYYDPAHFGYELVGMLDQDDLCYEFNMLGVWRRLSDGALFWAQDSGCSCPSPFEDYTDPSGSTWLSPLDKTRGEFEAVLRDFPVSPPDKQRLRLLAQKPFGATVLVTAAGATRV